MFDSVEVYIHTTQNKNGKNGSLFESLPNHDSTT